MPGKTSTTLRRNVIDGREKEPSPVTVEERMATGKALREKCPRGSQANWTPAANRPNPIDVLKATEKGRLPELLPIRYGRMKESPFGFYRGSAAIMAGDLAGIETTGIRVQACGDCHVSNFGGYASPERRLVFDINDFDETLPAPWEWDVKRLAASFVIAARHNGFGKSDVRGAAEACACAYRKHISDFAEQRTLDVWYARIDVDDMLEDFDPEANRRFRKRIAKAA